MKKIIVFSFIVFQSLILTSTSVLALCYSSKTNGEEIHDRACIDGFQATGLVVFFYKDGGSSLCGTATLIAPDALITSAHLIDPARQVKSISFQPHSNASPSKTAETLQQPKNIWVHPGYVHTSQAKSHDIAIIQLTEPLYHIRPALLQKDLPNDFDSAQTIVVGYGLSGNNREGGKFSDWKRRAGDINLKQDASDRSTLYMPFISNINETGFIDSRDGPKFAAIVAPGDSGGPAFALVKGESYPRILAITQGYATMHKGMKKDIFMSIPYYYPWIESKLRLCNNSNLGNKVNEQMYTCKSSEQVAWSDVKNALSTDNQEGSEVLQSLYQYAGRPEYKKAFQDLLLSVSDEGLALLYAYIEIHKGLISE